MFKEFDQSTFSLGLQGFYHNALHITSEYLSDASQTDTEHSFYLSNAISNNLSPAYKQIGLKSINNRVKTPVRINNKMSHIFSSHDV